MIDLDAELELALKRRTEYGKLRGLQATADDYVKGIYALLYSEAQGDTVGERDAWVKRQEAYHEAIGEKENRYADWEAANLKMKILFAMVEKYRTDRASERTMMRASE